MVVLPYGLLLVDSSPPDYKSFRSSEHKPHQYLRVADHGRVIVIIVVVFVVVVHST